MGLSELFRMIGIITHFVCVILFLVAMGTVNWMKVKHFEGKAGLWQYCNFHKNESATKDTAYTSPASNIITTTLSTTTTTDSDDTSDEENEEDECSSFGFIDIESYLLIVRMLIILALFCFAYGFFKGKTIRVKIEYNPNFFRQHTGELLSMLGAVLALFAGQIYSSSFKSDGSFKSLVKNLRGPNGEEGEDLLEIGWSAGLLEGAMITLIPAVVLMLMPTLNEKFHWCDNIGHRRRGRCGTFLRECRSDPLRTIRRCVACERFQPPISRNVASNDREVELSARRQSAASTISDGSIFTISDSRRNARGDNPEPAPRYEDLSPLPPTAPVLSHNSSLMPPPPSYDDVLKGLYATTPPSGATILLPPPYTDSPPPVMSSTSLRSETSSTFLPQEARRSEALSTSHAPIALEESLAIGDTDVSIRSVSPESASSFSQEDFSSRRNPITDPLASVSSTDSSHAPIAIQESVATDDTGALASNDTFSISSSISSELSFSISSSISSELSSSSHASRPRSRTTSLASWTRSGSRSPT
ncbi:hypothetical protein EGW08_021930 [Elysia chlorotica]|uniref:Uncharacterized protein n=1 Tax=Elysia chlorotica TaxID=188477 RepID=A0A3S0ZLR0_ELYCH|nr:hypothetical protein EGW08_021930 [Elysia chlorotica]